MTPPIIPFTDEEAEAVLVLHDLGAGALEIAKHTGKPLWLVMAILNAADNKAKSERVEVQR